MNSNISRDADLHFRPIKEEDPFSLSIRIPSKDNFQELVQNYQEVLQKAEASQSFVGATWISDNPKASSLTGTAPSLVAASSDLASWPQKSLNPQLVAQAAAFSPPRERWGSRSSNSSDASDYEAPVPQPPPKRVERGLKHAVLSKWTNPDSQELRVSGRPGPATSDRKDHLHGSRSGSRGRGNPRFSDRAPSHEGNLPPHAQGRSRSRDRDRGHSPRRPPQQGYASTRRPPQEQVQAVKKDCWTFIQTGDCLFGSKCNFNHPLRAQDKNKVPEVCGQVLPSSLLGKAPDMLKVQRESKWIRPEGITKFEETRETDEKKIASRQKQVDYGKNTLGYENYLKQVPRHTRTYPEHPRTPDVARKCSKRSFDGTIRKWRRMLHKYDPTGSDSKRRRSDSDSALSDEEPSNNMPKQMSGSGKCPSQSPELMEKPKAIIIGHRNSGSSESEGEEDDDLL